MIAPGAAWKRAGAAGSRNGKRPRQAFIFT
jgi:hypothetical protein